MKKRRWNTYTGRAMMDNKSEPGDENRMGCPRLFSTVKDFISFTQMLANGGIHKKERIMGRKTIDLMRKNQLSGRQLKDFQNSYLAGYGYGLGVRTLLDPAAGGSNSSPGEFGWTGGSGTWASIDPARAYLWFICIRWPPIWRDSIIYGSEPAHMAVWIKKYKKWLFLTGEGEA